jgi:hypothetical protein
LKKWIIKLPTTSLHGGLEEKDANGLLLGGMESRIIITSRRKKNSSFDHRHLFWIDVIDGQIFHCKNADIKSYETKSIEL